MPAALPAAGAAFVVAALAVGGPAGSVLAVAGVGLLLAGTYTRRDGFLLFGPLARWHLVRSARSASLFAGRSLLATAALFGVWGVFSVVHGESIDPRDPDLRLTPREIAIGAEAAFLALAAAMVFLVGTAAVFTLPAVVAEEREANRLDHLLVTDLRTHEILLGKVAGRAAGLFATFLVPVPVLTLLLLNGGVPPGYVLAAGGLLAGLAVGVTGVAVACSARSRSAAAAVGSTVLVLLGLLGVAVGCDYAAGYLPLLRLAPATEMMVGDALRFVGVWNPFAFVSRAAYATVAGSLDAAVGPLVRQYLTVNAAVLAVGWWVAVRRIRRAARRRPVPVPKAVSPERTAGARDGRGFPLWWLPAAGLGGYLWYAAADNYWWFGRILEVAMNVSGFAAFWAVTVPVGWAAARGVAGERENRTLDGLLLTELRPAEIVLRKWGRAFRAGRAAALALAVLWCTAAVVASPRVVAPLALNAVANAALAASAGSVASVYPRRAGRAVALLTLAVLYWSIGWGAYALVSNRETAGYEAMAAVPVAAQLFAGPVVFSTEATTDARRMAAAVRWNTIGSTVAAVALLISAMVLFHRHTRPAPEARPA